jgi:predicted SprT family Zn-dependent metalloprotease
MSTLGYLRLNPNVANTAPTDLTLTPYDLAHLVTYIRMLEADAECTDWREVSRIVLHIDPEKEPAQAKRAHESHLARARWMTETGYRFLLRGDIPSLN